MTTHAIPSTATATAGAAPAAEPTRCAYSIGRRLSLLLAVQTIIGLGVLLASIYAVTLMLFFSKQDAELRSYSAVLVEVLKEADAKGGEAEMRHRLEWLAERRPGTFVQVLQPDGTELYRDATPTFNPQAVPTREQRFEIPRTNNQAPLIGRLVIDCTSDAQHGRRMVLLLVMATLAGGAIVAWGTFWRVRCSLRPLIDLAAQTKAIDAGRLGQRLSLAEPVEELQPLIDQFNGLMQRVERTYVQLEGFNADVAHELRTPLATMIGQTEVALSRPRSAEELSDTLVSNLEELQRMAAIVNDMLFLAQADRGVKARRGPPVSLARLVQQVVDFHEASLEESRLGVVVEGDASLPVDEPLIKRALSNLLGNAIRHADTASTLRIHIARVPNEGVQLWVENQGPTIEPTHLPRLFDRFFRADSARSEPDRFHHGLGLSIVAAIARMHDGLPTAESLGNITRVGFSVQSLEPLASA
jgi:two-component system heavy metal sensor histidine kinase CusS